MANLPTSPVIVPADPNVEGENSGMNGGGSDSVIGICTDVPNPKESDWARVVVGARKNPIGHPDEFQSLVEYEADTFDGSPVGFAPADTIAAPGEVYATNVEGTGWSLTNKTEDYTTKEGDWLWGVAGGSVQPACKYYDCAAFDTGVESVLVNYSDAAYWKCDDPVTDPNTGLADSLGGDSLLEIGAPLARQIPMEWDITDCDASGGLGAQGYGANRYIVDIPGTLTWTVGIYANGPVGGINYFINRFNTSSGDGMQIGIDTLGWYVLWGDNVVRYTGEVPVNGYMLFVIESSGPEGNVEWKVTAYHNFLPIRPTDTQIHVQGFQPFLNPELWVFVSGSNVVNGFANVIWAPTAISPADVAILRDAWLQSQTDYVDPNPNCIPP